MSLASVLGHPPGPVVPGTNLHRHTETQSLDEIIINFSLEENKTILPVKVWPETSDRTFAINAQCYTGSQK